MNGRPGCSEAAATQPPLRLRFAQLITATIETFHDQPVTGYPAYPAYPIHSAGGAFSSSYPHYGGSSSSAGLYQYPVPPPPAGASSSVQQPLYASFEHSAPPGALPPPLACGIGAQWVIFICGWLLWPRELHTVEPVTGKLRAAAPPCAAPSGVH